MLDIYGVSALHRILFRAGHGGSRKRWRMLQTDRPVDRPYL